MRLGRVLLLPRRTKACAACMLLPPSAVLVSGRDTAVSGRVSTRSSLVWRLREGEAILTFITPVAGGERVSLRTTPRRVG
jgi:hypothetical protein